MQGALVEGTVFHGRYTVGRCLRAGGMGAVYECVHIATRKRRALKVMLPSLVADPTLRARFELEARVTADVDSEHIVETFDAGVDGETGAPFLVMELLRGEDLGAMLARRGRLPSEEVLLLLAQAASALDKTHAAGIIHRDLKPENLFVATRDSGSSRLKILDFGIAKLLSHEEAKANVRNTALVGTPLYMAPEQIDGTGAIDPRTDTYALAHIAYALLTGRAYWEDDLAEARSVYAFLTRVLAGPTDAATVRAARADATLPSAFDDWFARAAAASRESRFDKASDVVNTLAAIFDPDLPTANTIAAPRRAAFASVGAQTDPMAIAHAAVRMSAPVAGFGGRPAIAVLPFVNMSGDPEQEYFADGLAEDILTRLAMWRWFPVIARTSSFTFKGRSVDTKEVGRALGARYVLEGSVRKIANRVRVSGQLIDAETGHHVWAERYDRAVEDLFAIQDELTDSIANALTAIVGHFDRERARVKPAASLDAWETFQKGWWHAMRMRREELATAEELLHRAAALDPAMPHPMTGLSFVRVLSGFFLWSPPHVAFGEGMKHAQAALTIDPMDSFACSMLGIVLAMMGKLDEALTFAKRSLELNPSSPFGFAALGATYLFRAEPREGIEAGERMVRISPNDPLLHMVLGTLSANHYMAREHERAVEIAQLASRRAPTYPIGWRSLANALGQLGRLDEAREALAEFLRLMPEYTTEAAARASVGFRREEHFQYYLEGLRKAGWSG
jgi:TolB-like protein/tRNA A-37 threonylcarbamoyl transferase component Bud32